MDSQLIDKILLCNSEHHLFDAGQPIVIGVSGGADSIALLLALAQLRETIPLHLEAAHLNHGLRGEFATRDQDYVAGLCREMGIVLHIRSTDIAQLAAQNKIGIEEAGREARLAYFNELADGLDSQFDLPARIALAHHLNDQAETLLMHLGRGSGLDGLVGMKPKSGRIIRPLLNVPRQEIEAYLTQLQMAWQTDETNQDSFALRNRIRHQVLPIWQDALGYDPVPLLGRAAKSLSADQEMLDELAQSAMRDCCPGESIRIHQFLKLTVAMQNRVIRRFWEHRTGHLKELSFAHVQLIRSWLPKAAQGGQLCLPGGWLLACRRGAAFLESDRESGQQIPSPEEPVILRIPGDTTIPWQNCRIHTYFIEYGDNIVYNNTTACFDPGQIRGCVVRRRQPGDRIHPAGRLGGKLLKKFLNEQGVPPEQRSHLLVVAKGNEVVWLPGLAAGAGFAASGVHSDSHPVLCMTLQAL